MGIKLIKNKEKKSCPIKQKTEKNKKSIKWKMLGRTVTLFNILMSNSLVMALSSSTIASTPSTIDNSIAISPIYTFISIIEVIGIYILLPISCISGIIYWKKKKTMDEEKQKKNKRIINRLLIIVGFLLLLRPICIISSGMYYTIKYDYLEYYIENIIQGISTILFITGAEVGLIALKNKNKEIGVILILISVALYSINPYLTELICK